MHALLLRGAADFYTKQIGRIFLPGIPRQQIIASTLLFPPQEEDDPTHRLGDSAGKGESTSSSPGDTPMQATKGPQNQPFLSVDPTSAGQSADAPSDSVLPAESSPQASPPQPPSETPAPFGVNSPADFSPPQISQPQQSSPGQQAAAAPPVVQSAAQPAPQGDSDADPITTVGSVEFRRGSTNVRLGRNHKIIRPRLSLDAQQDLLTLAAPIVVLKLKLDETGHVTSATIFRSSGSTSVDEPVKIAAYKWWFEPAKNSAGKPIKDVILFTVGFIERS